MIRIFVGGVIGTTIACVIVTAVTLPLSVSFLLGVALSATGQIVVLVLFR